MVPSTRDPNEKTEMPDTDIYPVVTVGVPTYNRPDGLRRCLEALLGQSFRRIAIVISDNASTDPRVRPVIEEFCRRDPRVRAFFNSSNAGPTANFAAVLDAAETEYFIWCADDDWLEPDAIGRLVGALEDPDVSLACPSTRTHLDGRTLTDASIALNGTPFARVLKYYRAVGNNSEFYGLGRTKVFKGIGLRRRLADDWMFVAQLAYLGKIAVVPGAVLNRMGGGTSRSVENICAVLGVPAYVSWVPNLAIATAAAGDICSGRGVFSEASPATRVAVAAGCFALLYCRLFVMRQVAPPIIRALTKLLGEAGYRKVRQAFKAL